MSASRTDHPPNLVWDWTVAALSSVYTLPAAGVALSDPQNGLALAVGVLPAAIAGLLPRPMFGVGLATPTSAKRRDWRA